MKNTSDLRHKARQLLQGWKLCGWAAKNRTSASFWKALSWWWVEEYETRPALQLEAYTKALLSVNPSCEKICEAGARPELGWPSRPPAAAARAVTSLGGVGVITVGDWALGFNRNPPNVVQRVLFEVVFGLKYVGEIPEYVPLPLTPQESRLNYFLTNDNSN